MPAALDDAAPEIAELRDGIWMVGIPMPEQIPYSLCYLIEDDRGGIHVVDPGWDSDANWDRFMGDLVRIGKSPDDVASIVVTHLHHDHLGAAGRLASASGARVSMHRLDADALDRFPGGRPPFDPARLEEWGVPADRHDELVAASERHREPGLGGADASLDDDDVLDIPGRTITVIWTPGHTAGHLSLLAGDEGLVLTGDHVLPSIFSGIGLGGPSADPIADYLVSLGRISIHDDCLALPGHEEPFTGLAERASEIAQHHLRRSREVGTVLDARGQHAVWDVASQLSWTAGWENLSGFMLLSALAQTELHAAFVRSEAARAYL